MSRYSLHILCLTMAALLSLSAYGQGDMPGRRNPGGRERMRIDRRPRFVFDSTNPDVHDPVMACCDGKYYIFATGQGVGTMSSDDMMTWQPGPSAMPEVPQWAIDSVPGYRGHTWAPDIQYYNGKWYLYYSCSTFGKNGSAIGLMTNSTLNPESADYKWTDQGVVVRSVKNRTNWNAIDPNMIVDGKGNPWLTWGSFWDGIQLVKLGKDFKTPKGKIKTIARRYMRNNMKQLVSKEDMERANQAPDAGANAIEAPFIIKEGKYYYLFVSWDYCCKGVNSNYKVAVGRSKKVEGPYLDSKGKDMAVGGGDIIAERDDDFYGIGHSSAYKFDGQWYFMAHGYSRADNGASKLVIKKMHFNEEGWPVLDERVKRDVMEGLNINVIGDSYVANHRADKSESWHAKVAKAHNMTYRNYGRNGGAVAFDRTKDGFGKALSQRYVDMDNNADIVLIIAGHNDACLIGNSTDSLQIFRDSLDHLLTNLEKKYPKAQIGYVTPWFVDTPGFSQVCEVIRDVCFKHDVPVQDNYNEWSVIKVRDSDFRKKYFQGANDHAHLNNAGHDLFQPAGDAFVRRLALLQAQKNQENQKK